MLQERVASLQRTLANIESEKREINRNQVRLDKDNNALKKTLGKVSLTLYIQVNVIMTRFISTCVYDSITAICTQEIFLRDFLPN